MKMFRQNRQTITYNLAHIIVEKVKYDVDYGNISVSKIILFDCNNINIHIVPNYED